MVGGLCSFVRSFLVLHRKDMILEGVPYFFGAVFPGAVLCESGRLLSDVFLRDTSTWPGANICRGRNTR